MISQPVRTCQVVSSTRVPGTYRRPAGTVASSGPTRNMPAERSSIAANTLGPSGRGRQSHSTFPDGATNACTSRSDRKAYCAIGGNGLPSRRVASTTMRRIVDRGTCAGWRDARQTTLETPTMWPIQSSRSSASSVNAAKSAVAIFFPGAFASTTAS